MEFSLWVRGVVQQRPMPRMTRALELLIDRGREVHHRTALGERTAVVLLDYRAAPGGEHDRLQARQGIDGFPFSDPKARPRFFSENECDIDAGPRLDIRVAVVKSEVKHAREMPPHGGLARSHGADEKDIALAEHVRILYG